MSSKGKQARRIQFGAANDNIRWQNPHTQFMQDQAAEHNKAVEARKRDKQARKEAERAMRAG